MTPQAIWNEYLEREAAANARPEGADVEAIIRKLADDAGMPLDEVREIILARSFSRFAG